MRYSRLLSSLFCEQLQSGSLSGLLPSTLSFDNDSFPVDVHIREGDKLMFYHGTTSLLTMSYDKSSHSFNFSAALVYSKSREYQSLSRRWKIAEMKKIIPLIMSYLKAAISLAKAEDYQNKKEGFWQNRLSITFGQHWQPGMDWLIIDREAVIGFENSEEKQSHLEPIRLKYQTVKERLQQKDSAKWGQPNSKRFGDECGFLALGPDGELFCIELKHGSNTSGIYWGSLQVAVYSDLFTSALDCITEGIKDLVRQKTIVGLLPAEAESRLPEGNFKSIHPILAVTAPNDRSSCWKNLDEVIRECPESKCSIVEIRNDHDPAPIPRN